MSRFRTSGWRSPSPVRADRTSSIRGKISGPIPIADDDDDEFPIRAPGTSIATPLGHEGMEKQLGLTPPRPQREPSPNRLEEPVVEEPPESIRVSSELLPVRRLSYEIPAQQTTETNLGLVARDSTFAPVQEPEPPQRKKSTLRSVFGRLFGGRKQKSGSVVSKGKGSAAARHGQHHSDPITLRESQDRVRSQQRAASMPINEFNRALRSHSVITEESVDKGQNTKGYNAPEARTRPRRATTPSRIYTPTGGPGIDWGLAPRPASGHVRNSQGFADIEPQGAIGYAVTSGSHPNRRSRSLGQLRTTPTLESDVRRRSDEIRYWRESYDPDALSPMSSQKPEGDRPISLGEIEVLPGAEVKEQPQPFNFGPLGEMAGMKITQAASLETRVAKLEERMQKMERVINRLYNRISGTYLVLQDPPKGHNATKTEARPGTDSSEMSLPRHPANAKTYQQINSPQADTAFSSVRNQSQDSSRPSTMSTRRSCPQSYEELSPRPTYMLSPEQTSHKLSNANLSVTESMGRPLSTSTTVRGVASSSPDRAHFPFSKHGSLTVHHYTALINLIQAESSARQHLEEQVLTLQHQLHAALSGNAIPYPTRSSDRHLDHKTMGMTDDFSAFEHDQSENENESDDEADEVAKEDEFVTPSEERTQYGAPDEYEHEVGQMERLEQGDARTLSLSQMTLGKNALQSVV